METAMIEAGTQVRTRTIQTMNYDYQSHSKLIGKIALKQCPDYKFDDFNKPILRNLLYYFNGDPKFESELLFGKKHSLKKGILLNGPFGTGKSLIFQIFKEYLMISKNQNYYDLFSANYIIKNYMVDGIPALESYVKRWDYSENPNYPKQKPIALCIDDFGTEASTVTNYGNKFDPISSILFDRYDDFMKYGSVTHASSNLDAQQIIKSYSPKLVSRMREMFNIITLDGEDRRK